jgi:site-specific DNA-methyltransferase (adenine-specific)
VSIAGILCQPKSHEWETPPDLFRQLDNEFRFALDVAASRTNALCPAYITKDRDALSRSWNGWGAVWCNPPYGREIGRWVQKAFEEAQKGCTVVMLIPARTETTYWHDYVMHAAEIRFMRGRLRFSGALIDAPFPSAVVVFRQGDHKLRISAMDAPR